MGAWSYLKAPLPLSLKSHVQNLVSRGPTPSHHIRPGCIFGSKLLEMRKKREFVTKCCGYEEGESDEEFVKVLREAQLYLSVHINRVFVVVLSAEIVASPSLDIILKVPLPFPLILSHIQITTNHKLRID